MEIYVLKSELCTETYLKPLKKGTEGIFREDWERPLLRNIPIEDQQTTIEKKMLSSKLENLPLSIKDGGYADYLEPSSDNPILNIVGLKARNYIHKS